MKVYIKKVICILLLLLVVVFSFIPLKPVEVNAIRDVRNPVITEPFIKYNTAWETGAVYTKELMEKHEGGIKSIFEGSSNESDYEDRLLGKMSKYTIMLHIGNYCVNELGLTPEAAFGILGNVMAECSFNPASINRPEGVPEDVELTEENGGAIGIVQWLSYKDELILTYPDWNVNLNEQLKFLKYDLNTHNKNAYKLMKEPPPGNITDTADKIMYYAQIFNVHFERNHYNKQSIMMRSYYAYFIAENLNFSLTGGYSVSGIQDFDLASEVISPTSNFKITNGSILTTLTEQKNRRQAINEEILLSTQNGESHNGKTYSLYDRFGPHLEFVDYYGEELVDIGLFDHIVSAFVENKTELLEISDIWASYDVYLSGRVYKNRPQLLSNEQVHTGLRDARVDEFNRVKFGTRYKLILGTIPMKIAENIVGFVNLLLGNALYTEFHNVMNEKVYDGVLWKQVVPPIAYIFISFAMIAVIISIIRYTKKYVSGHTSLREILKRFGLVVVAIAVVFAALLYPKTFSNAIYTITTGVDQIFDTVLNDTHADDAIIHSDDLTNVREAAIWKTAMFEPWCKGTFGAKYENLYTQFADVSNSKKLAMSYEPDHMAVSSEKKQQGFYDAASVIGDVVVDRGNGVQERNWAALAWSTLSIYHIDETYYRLDPNQVEIDKIYDPNEHAAGVFPDALRTADNKFYADTFRWIDAKMDISPQYTIDGQTETAIPNYKISKAFKTSYFSTGWEMLWKAILLLGLLPSIIKKLIAFAKLMIAVLKSIVYSIKELFSVKQDSNGGLHELWTEIKDNFIAYIYASLQLFILMILYCDFVNRDSFLFTVAYIIAVFLVNAVTPNSILNSINSAKRQAKRLFSN